MLSVVFMQHTFLRANFINGGKVLKMYTCVEKGILENVSKCQKASWTIGQIGQINNTQDHFKINQF